ncbi:MAG: hypothetical protein M1825_003879 [Sarcosagium campestre]|nr:MAG: hypothetical protein M1825_003879 [Sarcosagium campestre]
MAKSTIDRQSRDSSNRGGMKISGARPNIMASCYIVDSASTDGLSGIPEVGSGSSSPPSSPPLAANATGRELGRGGEPREGAAYAITGECERLFCETMQAVFLGERVTTRAGSRVMATHKIKDGAVRHLHTGGGGGGVLGVGDRGSAGVEAYLEIWDYAGDASFRGFVGSGVDGQGDSLFVFFDEAIHSRDLKHGLVAILELACTSDLDCSRVVVCIDRELPDAQLTGLVRDLGWVGFELTTLSPWTGQDKVTSARWLLLEMEV